jgi:hypothetical protein
MCFFFYVNFFLSAGDIAFRFLKYAEHTPSSQIPNIVEENFDLKLPPYIESKVFTEKSHDSAKERSSRQEGASSGTGQRETHVTVCDINQAMLDEGKKKAGEMGITSGMARFCALN